MILQFGAGNFLRAFVDLFASEAGFDEVVVVQSTGTDRADALRQSAGVYHVAIQGFRDGTIVDETCRVSSIREALHAGTQWDQVLQRACDPALRWIVSNTTEAGFSLDDSDSSFGTEPPASFPAKLLAVLLTRHRVGLPGPVILPCELLERNADRLLALVEEQAQRWRVDAATVVWLREECRWINNLVDRIVPGPPLRHPLLGHDPLLISAEPFALWAIESEVPFELNHPAVLTTRDIGPYQLRKVRILNGLHTAMVGYALPRGIETVREAVEHPEVGAWLQDLLNEEIIPVLAGRVDDPAGFGRVVWDRFRNPFLEHRLSSIALHHETKLKTRLLPTLVEYRAQFGREPQRLASLLR
jgi:tagaturonate reductase